MSMKTATKRIPIIEELFYDTKGDLLKSPDVITFRAQDNYANLLVINLEDGIEDGSLVLVNFTPKNAVVSYTSHWFYARPLQNVREYIIVGEATPRVFSSYVIEVPRLVLNNYKENTTIENEITIVKRYGFHDLGVFNNYTDLINAHPANVELEQNNGFAYILNDSTVGGVLRKKGYYQVIYDNGNYTWVVRDNVMNFGLEQKQYETKKAFIAPGYANIKNVPNVESTVIEALWRDLSVIINDINDLKAFYDLQFATQETDTVYLEIDKVNESYFTIKADIKIDEVENDLLGKNENGLYVKHDISKAEKDLVDDIKETLDTHIEDLSNPHEVNAEQINTYEKEVIDQKDLDTLNEAKGYTYSQDIIDAKDQAILQEAKDYASEVADTFTKNEIIARDQAVLDEAKEYTDTNFVSNTTLDLQLLEKLNIRPNGTDLLVVGGKINTVYIDSLYITDIETVGTIPEMLALPNMKRGDIAIVVDENSSYVLTQTPSNVLGNWAKLLVQPSVISVNGKTGVVSIGISDIENLQGILDGKLSIITYESDKVILEQQIATSHLPKGFTTGTSPNYNVNIPNLVLSDGLQIAVSFNEANTAPPYLSLNSGTLIKINTLYGTALSPLILPNRYYILTYHIATNVWTIQMYNQMTNADIVNKTTEPKVISGKVLGDRLDEVESEIINYVNQGDNVLENSKQETLVSGTNIKTVNGETILGAGNLEISGVDLDLLPYMNYSSKFYYDLLKSALFKPAWERSLLVDPAEISVDSNYENPQGSAQYPNGATEGVIIPYGVETIGESAFDGFDINQPLVIPNSVTSIGQYAFYEWTSNNQPLVIPNSVIGIGESSFFRWSSNNQPLVIPNSVTSIGNSAFDNWSSNNQPLVISNSVSSIGNSTFKDWTSNKHQLVIPNSVKDIGNSAFSGWTSNNKPLTIPDSVETIGVGTFQDWSSNTHPLVIPSSVTSIRAAAFLNWRSVPYVEMKSETPPTLMLTTAFNNQNDAPIYVPDVSLEAYKTAANWSSYADRIFPVSEKP